MISYLTGKIIFKGDRFAILDVNGVGYHVYTTLDSLRRLNAGKGETVSLWMHLHVRENLMELYGFDNQAELQFFEMLIGISGIGPKGALSVLSVAPIDSLRQAIASGDTSYLTKVSGIGRKIAEKIVLELKEKLGGVDFVGPDKELKEETDVLEALRSLGYSTSEARGALKSVPQEVSGISARVKEALKLLGK